MTAFAAKNDAVTLADGWYAFKAHNTSRYAQFNGERIIKATVENPSITSGIVFYVTKGDGNKYTIQTPDGKFVTYKGTGNGDQVAVVAVSEANDNNKWWTIREGNSENLRTIVPSTNVGDGVSGWNFAVNYNGANGALGFWGCNDGGSQWIISKAPFVTVGKAKIKCANIVMSYDGENIVKADDENSIFTISKNETGDKFAIQTKDGKFLVNNNGVAVVDADAATAENKWWTIVMNIGNGAEGTVDILPTSDNITSTTNAFNWAKTIDGKGANSGLAYWSAGDDNSNCAIEWTETVECIYNLVYDGAIKGTETHQVVLGDFFPAATNELPFGVAATKFFSATAASDVNAEGKIVKDVTLVNTLPFEPAKSVDNIANWYYMNVRDDGPTYAYYDSSISYIKAHEKSVPAEKKDAYSWAFVGNAWDGFSIVNKVAGTTMVLSSPATPTGAQNADQLPRMVTANGATGNTTWMIVKPTHGNVIAKNGFYIQHPTATGYAINRQSYSGANTLCYWTGRDTGSTFQVVLRDDTEELLEAIADAEVLVESVTGDGVGYATSESVSAIYAAIEVANKAVEDKTGFVAAMAGIQSAIANIKIIQPDAEKFYTIKNKYTGNYMNVSDVAGATVYGGAPALNEMFVFEPVKDNDGVFYLYNVKRGQYLSSGPSHGSGQVAFAVSESKYAKPVTIKNLGVANQVSITPNGGATLHNDTNYSTVVGWNKGADSKSAWLIEEVSNPSEFVHTLTVTEAGYATLCLACNVVIPDGVEAYAATEFDEDGNLELEQITGVLPAYEAVIVKAAADSYTFAYTASQSEVKTNLFEGTTVNTNITEAAYVLGNANGIGMYKAEMNQNDGNAWRNNAFKAYLPASVVPTAAQGAANFSFRFPDTTGVEDVVVENEVKTIFDITGRKVEAITAPGIYIVNGKKVLVK